MNFKDFKIFRNIPTLKTERLTLRMIDGRDLYDIFEYSSDPEVSRYLLWSPHKNISVTKNYLGEIRRRYRRGQFYDWAIEFRGKMIGTCGFSRIDILNDTSEAGYVVARRFWGMGIAPEALREIIRFGFTQLSLNKIECRCLEENVRSLAVMKKCGLTVEELRPSAILHDGIMKSVYICSIEKEKYQ